MVALEIVHVLFFRFNTMTIRYSLKHQYLFSKQIQVQIYTRHTWLKLTHEQKSQVILCHIIYFLPLMFIHDRSFSTVVSP